MLAAVDDSILNVVVLVLLGAGSLVKSFLDRKKAQEGEAGAGSSVGRSRRNETRKRLAKMEGGEKDAPAKDPWQVLLEGGDPRTAEDGAAMEEEVVEPVFIEEPVAGPSAPTPEVSIESEALGGLILERGSFDDGTLSTEPWDPGERIRKSVFEDIEQSVRSDVSEHVAADMGEGVRGEGQAEQPVHLKRRAHRGWRDAVVAAEVLGAPLALRDSESQPGGLRNR